MKTKSRLSLLVWSTLPFVILFTVRAVSAAGVSTSADAARAGLPTPAKRLAPTVQRPLKPINTCGNAASAPQIFSHTLMIPQALQPDGSAPADWNPAYARMTRGGIEYVASNAIRYELVTDNCTYISAISVGSTTLTDQYVKGYWYALQPPWTPQPDPSRTGYSLWIFFPNTIDGSTEQVTITVGRIGGSGTATYSVPVVHVAAVYDKAQDPSYLDGAVTISRADMWNLFTSAIYKQFNGAQNSFTITNSDGSTRRIYGYDPSSFQLTLDTQGISFEFKFKADIAHFCDADVRAYGTFMLTASDAGGIGIQWQQGLPQASTSESWCEALGVTPILGEIIKLITDDIQSQAQGSVLSSLTSSISSSLPNPSDQIRLTLDGTKHLDNEARVLVKIPMPSIQIQVPYDAFALGRTGTLFPSNDPVLLVASGLGTYDRAAKSSPPLSLWPGPDGVPLAGTITSWPNPETIGRSEPLVYPGRPVASLLFQHSNQLGESTYAYSDGCAVNTADQSGLASSPFIVFGVNDTTYDAARLREYYAPGYSLRVFFVNGLLATKSLNICKFIFTPTTVRE